ncbi:class F sortase [Brachybacterium huguangmaarense]
MNSARTKRPVSGRRTRRPLTGLLAVVSTILLVAGIALVAQQVLEQAEAPKDLDGNAVHLDPADTPAAGVTQRMEVRDGTVGSGDELSISSVGLDVPLGSLLAVDGEITPPGFTQAYWVRNLGVGLADATKGTVYVVMHSVRAGNAPGNAVIDVGTGKVTVADGSYITVGPRIYHVTESFTVLKGDLASREDLWKDSPGRLVLITCLQREDGHSLRNAVIIADLDT